ncbi:MAG: Sporulation protein [Gemmatimonadales bacterium]|nr:Sporulation protein [Gemmatimonadales bacterium]
MSQKVSGGRPIAWEDAGRQVAPVLGSYSAIVVISTDPLAAAYVALGIARAEAEHRRSVVGDLVGDLPPLRSLVRDEEAHGITDSFLYGVSLNKIGYDVEGVSNLYVMPSGTDPLIDAEIMQSQRWTKLATGFAEAGAFLVLVARSDAPGLADLVDQLDGVVLVKDPDVLNAPSALILARVAGPTPTLKIPLHRISAGAARWPRHKWLYPGLGALAVLVAGGLGLALMLSRTRQSPRPGNAVVAAGTIGRPVPPPPRAAPETLYIAPPENAIDSLSAATFSVELLVANTAEGANLFVRKNGAALPAAAVSPVPIGPEQATWYRVTAGAYTRREQADSLLRRLRESRLLANDSVEHVMQTPLALLVDSVPSQGGMGDAVNTAVQKYAARGLPVYTLMQDDGGARIYAGAFKTASQSAELIKSLRAAGLKPVLVYRTGSTP